MSVFRDGLQSRPDHFQLFDNVNRSAEQASPSRIGKKMEYFSAKSLVLKDFSSKSFKPKDLEGISS